MNLHKKMILMGTLLAAIVLLSGCGKKIEVTIIEPGTDSQLTVSSGLTVEEILAEAQISIREMDKVTPDRDEKITEDQTQIVISRYAKVTVVAADESVEVECYDGTVRDAIDQSGLTVGENDAVSAALDAALEDGMTIEITRQREVSLTVDGAKKSVVTEAATVAEFLEEQGITLGENDRVKPKKKSALENGAEVVVKRVEIKEETVTEEILFETKKQYSDAMASGDKKVTTEGINGEKEVVYHVTYVDGKEESREAVSEKETKAPVTEVVTYGTGKKEKSSEKGSEKKSDDVPSVGDTIDGKKVVSRQQVDDCDGSGHGYYLITYDDGSEEYIDY